MMRSTFGGLNTMVRGMFTHQISLDTVGHNITNANTKGYSRQVVNLSTAQPQRVYGFYGDYKVGTGNDVDSLIRARDTFADKQYWKENSILKQADSEYYSLDKLESIFQEPSETGLQTVLNDFWKSWQTLSTNASEYSNRVMVRDKGKALVNSFQLIQKQMKELVEDNNSSIQLKTDSINQITSELLSLNKQIKTSECGMNGMANDLRDRRDLLVDELSALIKVDVTELSDGTYSVSCAGNTLVSGDSRLELKTVDSINSEYGFPETTIVEASTGIPLEITGGAMKGYYESREKVKGFLDQMTTMTAFLLKDVNDNHKAGFGLGDQTGHNFFGDDAKNYSSLAYDQVSQEWKLNGAKITANEIMLEFSVNTVFDQNGGTDLIAAKTKAKDPANPDQEVASGDNASLMAELLHMVKSNTLNGNTLSGFYIGMIGTLGNSTQEISNRITNQENIVSQVEGWRQQTAGVNWDEELSNMIRFSTGYKACSRCLTTMDEMLEKLISGTGVVGR